MKSVCMTPPDYDHPVIVKTYSDSAMASPFVAPQNGYLIGTMLSLKQWCFAKVDGKQIVSTGKGDGFCWGDCNHYSVFYLIRKGQSFILEGGSYHALTFYPCTPFETLLSLQKDK